MDFDAQLKLQAFLDGELPEAERNEVANWLARDKEATALLGELRDTRKAMVGFEIGVELPESREFFWSKLEREIQRLEPPMPARAPAGFFRVLRSILAPAAAVAVLVIAGFVAIGPRTSSGTGTETALADSSAFTYHDYSAGTTLVWLSYPADNDATDEDEEAIID
jgi:anti-sigma factor RsiW